MTRMHGPVFLAAGGHVLPRLGEDKTHSAKE